MGQIKLREARENCGLTLEEASIRTGFPVSTIQKYEHEFGKVVLSDAMKLLNLYKISSSHISFELDSDRTSKSEKVFDVLNNLMYISLVSKIKNKIVDIASSIKDDELYSNDEAFEELNRVIYELCRAESIIAGHMVGEASEYQL